MLEATRVGNNSKAVTSGKVRPGEGTSRQQHMLETIYSVSNAADGAELRGHIGSTSRVSHNSGALDPLHESGQAMNSTNALDRINEGPGFADPTSLLPSLGQ